jgi:Phage ABA sandwich domain
MDQPEAGPELDALVAEKVMGCKTYLYGRCPNPFLRCGCENQAHEIQDECNVGLKQYSTDIAAAWEVVEKLKNAWCFSLLYHQDNLEWNAEFEKHTDPWNVVKHFADADAAPLGICRAALQAVDK